MEPGVASGRWRAPNQAAGRFEEGSWIAASQQGDAAAFNRLVLKWEKPIYNLCLRMLRDSEDAADATQEVFLKAFRAIRRFRQNSRFSTWLYRIAANQCVTRLKSRGGHRAWSLDDEELHPRLDQQLPAQESHEQGYLQHETREHVLAALARLSPDQRLVVELKFFQELTFEEIAAVVETPLSTVKSRLYQGLAVLKRHLRGLGEL